MAPPVTAPAATDKALRGIVLANAVTLVLAVVQQWSVLQLMWPFWMQSVIIGWYSRQRILALREFVTDGLTINDRAVDPTPETQRRVASFFVLHYGGFHAAYLFFLWIFSTTADPAGFVTITNESSGTASPVYVGHIHPLDVVAYLVLAFGFWRSHGASHREHVRADLAGRPNLGTLMFMPYARIVPMHLTLIAGVPLGGGAVWLFVLLKTAADVIMHKVEHRMLGGRRAGGARTNATGSISR